MRITSHCIGVMLLAACAHGGSSQPPPPAPAPATAPTDPTLATAPTQTNEDLGTLQRTSTAVEARHEPGAPDPRVSPSSSPSPSPAGTTPVAAAGQPESPATDTAKLTPEESALRERIQRRLLQDKSLSYTAQRVRLDVKRNEVTVQGEVRTAREKQEVEQLIESISGVRRVNNQLAVIDQTNQTTPSGLHTR
ncbi:MAG TPA: BON domain-containing protein [Polyangiales bacterium]